MRHHLELQRAAMHAARKLLEPVGNHRGVGVTERPEPAQPQQIRWHRARRARRGALVGILDHRHRSARFARKARLQGLTRHDDVEALEQRCLVAAQVRRAKGVTEGRVVVGEVRDDPNLATQVVQRAEHRSEQRFVRLNESRRHLSQNEMGHARRRLERARIA
ncbi:MAG: hypothetical protein P8Y76_02790 [bacterium]